MMKGWRFTPQSNPAQVFFNLLRLGATIALALHLGWSWWLVALLLAVVVVEIHDPYYDLWHGEEVT